jgi:hypothetical protein
MLLFSKHLYIIWSSIFSTINFSDQSSFVLKDSFRFKVEMNNRFWIWDDIWVGDKSFSNFILGYIKCQLNNFILSIE